MEPLNPYGQTRALRYLQSLGLAAGDFAPTQVAAGAGLGVSAERAGQFYRQLASKGYLEKRGAKYLIVTYGSLEKDNEDRHV